jgi:two-component system phosphoglycerate transport system sensor histidine kinase PgtB
VLRQLRDFYQGGAHKIEDVNVSTLCEGVLSAFQERLRRHDVSLSAQLQADLPTVQCDGTRLQIVLHNLMTNAVEAVIGKPAGQRRIDISAKALRGTIVVTVEDSGAGIPAAIAKQLFEPFTTSKPDGMGLGLAISRSLMRASGGELACVRSSSLGGAAFIITIPLEVPLDLPL